MQYQTAMGIYGIPEKYPTDEKSKIDPNSSNIGLIISKHISKWTKMMFYTSFTYILTPLDQYPISWEQFSILGFSCHLEFQIFKSKWLQNTGVGLELDRENFRVANPLVALSYPKFSARYDK